MHQLTAEDQAGIQQLFQAYGEVWAHGDSAACAALYASDGDAVAIDGEVLFGPAEIERYYARQLSGPYKDLTITDFAVDPPRALQRDTALMNASWMLHGFRGPGGAPTPVRVRATFVMRRDGGAWRYVAARFMVPFQGQL